MRGQRLCGAKTRKGTECKGLAMPNGRCKLHGGKTPPTPTGAANPAYTHGIYTKFFREDEKALLDAGAIRLGQVDDELRVVRVRLKRALEARELWEAERDGRVDGANEETSLVLVERVDGDAIGPEGVVLPVEKTTKRLPDFDTIIDRCLARIESLEKTRKELLKEGGPGDDESGATRDSVTFTGGLGGTDDELPSPFDPKP